MLQPHFATGPRRRLLSDQLGQAFLRTAHTSADTLVISAASPTIKAASRTSIETPPLHESPLLTHLVIYRKAESAAGAGARSSLMISASPLYASFSLGRAPSFDALPTQLLVPEPRPA